MTNVTGRILDGNYTSENAGLDLSESKLEATTYAGDGFEGSFHVYAPEGYPTEGFVVSSDLRMELTEDQILGPDSEIRYRFRGDLCEAGDVVKGVFSVISNAGEYYLPFVVTVERFYPSSSIGEIRDLFHFTNLAKGNWSEAVRLFYSEDFPCVLASSDQAMKDAYRALSAHPGNEQNLEEFLICTGKKQRLEYVSHTDKLHHVLTDSSESGVHERQIELIRNGWGYTNLEVSCEGDFLFTEDKRLTDDDFLGNVCTLMVFIDSTICSVGRHYGKVILQNPYTRLEIPVEVSVGGAKAERSLEHDQMTVMRQITSKYVLYRLGLMPEGQWLHETDALVKKIVSFDEEGIFAQLCKAHLLAVQDKKNEAGWTLDYSAELLEREMNKKHPMKDLELALTYHSYLMTQVLEDDHARRDSEDNVEQLYRRNRQDWRIAWLYLMVFGDRLELTERWNLLEDYAKDGCNSPVLYMEAVQCVKENPAILQKPTEFTIRTIYFGTRKRLFGEEILEDLILLCARNRSVQKLLLDSLKMLYADIPDRRLLQEICVLLIRSDCKDENSRKWYRKAVAEEIRITNLFEYYMMSLDLRGTEELPKSVLLYFSMPSGLDDSHKAYLYHYLIQHQRELPDLYEKNRESIHRFALEQISKRKIERHLAAIYYDVLTPDMLNRELAESLASLLFANWLETKDERCSKVVVYQNGYLPPMEFELENGEGWVSLYGTDYTIALEDAQGNRYLKSVDYTLEKMMLPGRFLHGVAREVWGNPRLNLFLCGEEHGETEVNKENLLRYEVLSECKELEPEKRRSFALRTLDYYAQHSDHEAAARLLAHTDLEGLGQAKKRDLLPLLFRLGQDDRIWKLIGESGPYFADPRDMQNFLDKRLTIDPDTEDPLMVYSCVYAVGKGRRDSLMLTYLGRYFRGQTRDLRDIWKASKGYGVDRLALAERMLVQMLFSGAFVGERQEIFEEYAAKNPASPIVKAFLLQTAYDFFVHEKLTDEKIFSWLCYLYDQGEDLPRIAKLSVLKYYAENPEFLTEEIREVILELLSQMMEERLHPGFFLDFLRGGTFPPGEQKERLERILEELLDKTIVDYRAREGNAARIHYMMASKNGEIQEYIAEYMTDIGYGICFKEFILFFGESMQYYITEEGPNGQELTTSGDLQKSDITGEGDRSRFGMIQDCLISNTLQDYGTMEDLIEEYSKREFIGREVFRIK